MLNPDTNSDSPSEKSNGVRFVSAIQDTTHRKILNGAKINKDVKKEFFISGGIGLDSVNLLKNLFKMNLPLYGIDVNSKFEDSNNRKIIKDLKKFKEIIENEI